MGKLAASILSADLAHLADEVKLVEPYADIIHVDIMDGHSVPPIALGTVLVASLRPWTDPTLHGHLMVDAPESSFEELAEAGLDVVSFHHEAVGDPEPAIAKARDAGLRTGVTLNLETPVEAAFPYLEQIDGGVTIGNAQRAVDAGATVLVSAFGIYRAPDEAEAARTLAEIASSGQASPPARGGAG